MGREGWLCVMAGWSRRGEGKDVICVLKWVATAPYLVAAMAFFFAGKAVTFPVRLLHSEHFLSTGHKEDKSEKSAAAYITTN